MATGAVSSPPTITPTNTTGKNRARAQERLWAGVEDTVGAGCTPQLTPHPLHLLSRKEVSYIKPILVLIPGKQRPKRRSADGLAWITSTTSSWWWDRSVTKCQAVLVSTTFLSCSACISPLWRSRAFATAESKARFSSSFCLSRASSMCCFSVAFCCASSLLSWSIRRWAWAINAFRSSVESLSAKQITSKILMMSQKL